MKFKGTLILLIVVILLFLFVYIFEIRNPNEPEKDSKELGKILAVEGNHTNKLELAYADPEYDKIVCSQDDGQWQIEQPIKARADNEIVRRLISGSLQRKVHNTLKKPEKLSEYGLDNPRVSVTFHLQDGTSRMIMLGNTVPTGNYVYVKQNSAPEIYLVPASIADDLTKFASDLRDRSIITLKNSDVRRIQLKYSDRKSIVCEKKEFEWNLIEPIAAKADPSAVEGIISDLRNLKAEKFIDDIGDLAVYGLSEPQIEVIVSIDGSENPLNPTYQGDKSLLIGNQENSLVYVKTRSDNEVFMANADIVGKLARQPSDLRDKTVIAFEKGSVHKLELKSPKLYIVCEKKTDDESNEAWQIIVPIMAKADKPEVDEILRQLQELRVEKFISDASEDLAVYGLNQPEIRATIHSGEAKPKELMIGKKTGESVYAKSSSSASVYLVNSRITDVLSKGILDLRDRQVMEFQKNNVKRMELKRKDGAMSFIKQEHDWRIVEPVKEKAKNYVIDDMLDKLDDLKAERFVEGKAGDLSRYGLDKPDMEAIVILADGSTRTLLVGKMLENGGSAYAKTAADDAVFIIEKSVLDELGKKLEEIKE